MVTVPSFTSFTAANDPLIKTYLKDIVRLVGQVVRVSVETVRIVKALPECP